MSKLIKDFASKDVINQPMFIKNVLKGATDKGAPYLTITLQDKSGSISSKLWNVSDDQEEMAQIGRILNISGDVIDYNNSLQVRIRNISEIDGDEIDMEDFIIKSDVSEDLLKEKINNTINSINNVVYRNIIKELYDIYGTDFYKYPAAAKIHHSFLGGLAVHVCGMISLAEEICKLYPQLNRDLLLAGVLAHDIGKMVEFSGPITTEYTLEGKLIGHISIVQGQLMEIAQKLNYSDKEESILLRHMVLSHHGHLEYGSPVLPMLQEAEILYLIDNLDARLNALDTLLKPVKPGSFSPKIFSLENRAFYKPKD